MENNDAPKSNKSTPESRQEFLNELRKASQEDYEWFFQGDYRLFSMEDVLAETEKIIAESKLHRDENEA